MYIIYLYLNITEYPFIFATFLFGFIVYPCPHPLTNLKIYNNNPSRFRNNNDPIKERNKAVQYFYAKIPQKWKICFLQIYFGCNFHHNH